MPLNQLPGAGLQITDLRRERPVQRRAVARGQLQLGADCCALLEQRLPHGDALLLAQVAGLQGARNVAQLVPLHAAVQPDHVSVRCLPLPGQDAVRVYCEVAGQACASLVLEALAGVSAALLCLCDQLQALQPVPCLHEVRLLFEEGGAEGLRIHPRGLDEDEHEHYRPQAVPSLAGARCAVITLSDRAHAGGYADRSGPLLVDALQALGAVVADVVLLPDGVEPLATRLKALAAAGAELVLCTGGTGIGPRDLSPEALRAVADRPVPGLGELLRSESRHHTPLAWLSRAEAGLIGRCLVVTLPGSPRAVAQGMAILGPLLAHARAMLRGESHPNGGRPHA